MLHLFCSLAERCCTLRTCDWSWRREPVGRDITQNLKTLCDQGEREGHKEVEMKKEDEVIDVLTPGICVDMPQHAIEVFAMLKDATYLVCTIQKVDFRDMGEERKVNHGKSLVQAVYVVFADFPYNVRRVREGEHFHHDRFSLTYMKDLISF